MFFKGHEEYESLIENMPVDQMKEDIMSSYPDYVETDEISYTIKNSIVAIEDHRFYSNGGVDYIALARALISNIFGDNVQGASTITMQLAKNYYYEDTSRSFIRKFAEVFFANAIEANYSKEEILEMYLNIIYYGDGYTGIYDSCMGYFEDKPINVDYVEASLLAGIINAPSVYALSTGADLALQRQVYVINALYTYNYIDEETKTELLSANEELVSKYTAK